jgi:iron only hydrogenase large subunit-like protein
MQIISCSATSALNWLCFLLLVPSVAAAKKDGKVVIAQIAPAVRVAIAETMGLPPGAVTIGQMVTGLRQIGFDYVFGELLTQPLAVVGLIMCLVSCSLSRSTG